MTGAGFILAVLLILNDNALVAANSVQNCVPVNNDVTNGDPCPPNTVSGATTLICSDNSKVVGAWGDVSSSAMYFRCCFKGYGGQNPYNDPTYYYDTYGCDPNLRDMHPTDFRDSETDYYSNPLRMTGYTGINVGYNSGVVIQVGMKEAVSGNYQTNTMNPNVGIDTLNTFNCQPGAMIYGFDFTLRSNGQLGYLGIRCMSQRCASLGQYANSNGLGCTSCPSGKYNANVYATACAACTNGGDGASYTSSGPTSNACSFTCNAGYGYSNPICAICPAGKSKGVNDLSACGTCQAGTYSANAGSTVCSPCPGGTYQPNSGTSTCLSCSAAEKDPAPGYYRVQCTATTPPSASVCIACGVGYYLNPPCDPSSYTVPACQACSPGTFQPTPIPVGWNGAARTCQSCLVGKYSNAYGSNGCLDCSKKPPANGDWATPSGLITGDSCPIQCNWGYQMDALQTSCTACPLGKYTNMWAGTHACVPCTFSLVNAYWLQSSSFNRSWNGCPWDCNAGYTANYATGVCVPCVAGTYFQVGTGRADADKQPTPNVCISCQTCSLAGPSTQGTYEISPCTTTQNRQCTACSSVCSSGYYMQQACTLTSDVVCAHCKTACNAGQYMTGTCTGSVSAPTRCVPVRA